MSEQDRGRNARIAARAVFASPKGPSLSGRAADRRKKRPVQGEERMDTDIGALTVIFTEFYYWITVPLMFLIHVGFCMYEVGASRRKNHLHTLMKNTMLIPLVTITFFFFGWWLYFAFPNGPFITGGLVENTSALPRADILVSPPGGPPGDDNHWATDAKDRLGQKEEWLCVPPRSPCQALSQR